VKAPKYGYHPDRESDTIIGWFRLATPLERFAGCISTVGLVALLVTIPLALLLA